MRSSPPGRHVVVPTGDRVGTDLQHVDSARPLRLLVCLSTLAARVQVNNIVNVIFRLSQTDI